MDPIVNALFVSGLIACNESPSLPPVVRPPEKGALSTLLHIIHHLTSLFHAIIPD
jgi:hypothetical protein